MDHQRTINHPMTEHLTDEQLEDVLLDDAGPEALAHLAACAFCRAQNDVFVSSVQSFNQASLAWSQAKPQARSNALPLTPSGTVSRSFPAAAWAFAATLLVLVALLLVHAVPHAHTPAQQAQQAGPNGQHPASADPQIAADNVLLADIDSALDQPDPQPDVLPSAFSPSDLFGHPAAQPGTTSAR